MKKFHFAIVFLLLSTVAVSPVEAQLRDPSLTAKVTRQTPFNILTDTVATFGKSEAEKNKIIRRRKEARRIDRLKKIHAQKKTRRRKEKLKMQESLRGR